MQGGPLGHETVSPAGELPGKDGEGLYSDDRL